VIVNKFQYKPISRTDANGKRLYLLPDGSRVPSVTTILDATKTAEKMRGLMEWRKRVGNAKATQITTEAANVGTVMHKKLEEYCLGTNKPAGSNHIQKQAHDMAQVIIDKGLVHMNEVWGVEINLYHSGLYAGTTDCLGEWKNEPAIIDFKQTNKPKKDEWIEDYRIQLAAYIEAHNSMFGTDIKRGVVLMCSRNLDYQQWVIEGDVLKEATNQWWLRVEEYYRNIGLI
jgi:genome maintenance exonuclease 1